jgi:hypothetical protein
MILKLTINVGEEVSNVGRNELGLSETGWKPVSHALYIRCFIHEFIENHR